MIIKENHQNRHLQSPLHSPAPAAHALDAPKHCAKQFY